MNITQVAFTTLTGTQFISQQPLRNRTGMVKTQMWIFVFLCQVCTTPIFLLLASTFYILVYSPPKSSFLAFHVIAQNMLPFDDISNEITCYHSQSSMQ